MKKNAITLSIAALSLCFSGLASAQNSTPAPQQTYQEALKHCQTLSGEARVNCRRDVQAAHQDRKRKHTTTDMQTLEKNRTARCNRLPESQRQHCLEQMQGKHHTKKYGSVQGGGILRHTTIEIPGEPYEVRRPTKSAPTAPPAGNDGSRVITPIQ